MSITQEQKQALSEYAELKIQTKNAEARMKELQPLIVGAMQHEGIDKIPTSKGSFTLQARKTWTYSGVVEELKANLDARKEQEEADGTASYKEAPVLQFRESKEE